MARRVFPMRIALLSCGPSLPRWEWVNRSDYAVVVGVNRAVARYSCDWWSAGDAECFTAVRPIGRPHLWTHAATLYRIGREHPTRATEHEAAVYHRCERKPWTIYSATAALMLALEVKATRIDCFGVDMAGTQDWDGSERGCRDESRWSRERAAWGKAVDLLAAEGITVARL